MLAFDAMSREVCTAKRESTTTPLQSLVLLNDPQFVEAARVFAERLLKTFAADETARHREAFRALTGRAPDRIELDILARLFRDEHDLFLAHPDDARAFAATGDSKPDPSLAPADVAALTAVVSAIMNQDEFVVVR
jgi:hypothetical protein